MYSKLAFKSAKRSFSDYAIYFLTLTIGVSLFYAFNCLSQQQVMLDLSAAQKEMMLELEKLLTLVSIFVSVILGFLCLFANQFLMKRRKKELGLYMTLGMSKGTISRMLILETSLVSLISLGAGLLLGGVISQGMAVITASLFDTAILSYKFVFSIPAMLKTIIFFCLIFIVVMTFNTVVVSRYQLIDLLTARRKNEKLKVQNPITSAVLFTLSLLFILAGYILLDVIALRKGIIIPVVSLVLLLAGTFIFYYSGTSFILTRLQKHKRFYFKGTNMFLVRQVYSKVNTGFLSMTIISLMLFFTMSILSTGFSYKHSLEQDLAKVAPYDASVSINHWFSDADATTYDALLKDMGVNLSDYGNYIDINVYRNPHAGQELFGPYAVGQIKSDIDRGSVYGSSIISYSDYVKLMTFKGSKPLTLKDNETLIISNMNIAFDTIQNFINQVDQIEIANTSLNIYKGGYEMVALETETLGRNFACFVVPDRLTSQLESMQIIFNLDYTSNPAIANQELGTFFNNLLHTDDYRAADYNMQGITKEMVYEEVSGQTTQLVYIGIYLGLIFLISSGAVLALQLLSEASDSQHRYESLKRIGATKKQIKKVVFAQVAIYFMTPLILALSHAAFTVYFVNKNIVYGTSSLIVPATVTICLFLILYGGYLLATYTGYKRIVK